MRLKRMKCFLFGHDLKFEKVLTELAAKVTCSKCKKSFVSNHEFRLVIPWSDEVEKFYVEMHEIYKNIK